jgi:hypothetical protein
MTRFLSDQHSELGFDLLQWYPAYQSCQRFFVNHAQYSGLVQAVTALVNIRLPFQWREGALFEIPPEQPHPGLLPRPHRHLPQLPAPPPFISLIPYIRRLIVTRFDKPGVLEGFFGEDWVAGIGPLHEVERRNYLFAAKSVGWAQVKLQYDLSPEQSVPWIQPMLNAKEQEIQKAEKEWSNWLAMEDWMLGPRAP